MTGESWYNGTHCRSGAHCPKCRDMDGGREWRRGLMAQFADLMRVDFICPHGRPWGTRDAAPRVTVPDWIKPLDMQALLEQIECMPEPARTAGLGKWTEQNEKIEKANCRGCAVNAATSRVRVWLAQTLEETK